MVRTGKTCARPEWVEETVVVETGAEAGGGDVLYGITGKVVILPPG